MFTYGHDGMMVKQVVDGVETRFVNSLPLPSRERAGERGSMALQERDSSNGVVRSYVWDGVSPGGIGGLLEMTDSTGTYSYLYDGKGNVRALMDTSNGSVVASYAYDEFGVQVSESGTPYSPAFASPQRLRFSQSDLRVMPSMSAISCSLCVSW